MKKNEPIVPTNANKYEIITVINEIIQSLWELKAETSSPLEFGILETINALHHKIPHTTRIAVQIVAQIEDFNFLDNTKCPSYI